MTTSQFLPALFCVGNASSFSFAVMGLVVFGLGWGFFDCNNIPIMSKFLPAACLRCVRR